MLKPSSPGPHVFPPHDQLLGELLTSWSKRAAAAAGRAGLARQDGDDLLQQAVVRFLSTGRCISSTYSGDRRLLSRMLRFVAIEVARHQRAIERAVDGLARSIRSGAAQAAVVPEAVTDGTAEALSRRESIASLFDALRASDKVLLQRWSQGVTYTAIAREAGTTAANCRQRIHRLLASIRKHARRLQTD